VRNLACNFNINSFVESYLECIKNSQDESFVRGSFFNNLTSASATESDVKKELEYFVDNARIWEYEELDEISEVLKSTPKHELPKTMTNEHNDVFERFVQSYIAEDVKKELPDADVFLYDQWETKHTRFSKELTFCLRVVAKFWTFTMGPMLTGEFYTTTFWSKFIEGSKPDVVSHIVNISEVFDYAIWSKSLEKIKKDDLVTVTGGVQERLSQTNKVKNILPYAAIRDALRRFDRKPEYSYLGLDGSKPKAFRLSLGAFISIFSWIRDAEQRSNSTIEFGAVQTDMGVLKVYQPAFDSEEGHEDSPSNASSHSIGERLRRLSSKYTICIGQNDTYVQDTVDENLEVFTFITPEGINISTLGLYKDDDIDGFYVYDAKGQNNGRPVSLGDEEQRIAMVKWFEGLIFKYCIDDNRASLEKFVKSSLHGNLSVKIKFSKKTLRLADEEENVEKLFISHASYLPLHAQTIEEVCGAARKTTELLRSALPKGYTQDQLNNATRALIHAGDQIGCDFFKLLFNSRNGSTNMCEKLLEISNQIDNNTQENFTPEIRQSF